MEALTLLKQDIQQWNQWRANQNHKPCSLANQNLSNGYFFEGDFRGVDLSGTVFESACLIGANLQGTNLRGANLRGAYLDKANLNGADIRDADFSQANIISADLSNVRIENTLFTDANITQTTLSHAISKGTQPSSLQQTKSLIIEESTDNEPVDQRSDAIRNQHPSKVIKETPKSTYQQTINHALPAIASSHHASKSVATKEEALPISYRSAQQLFDHFPLVGDNSEAMYEAVIVPLKPSTQETDTSSTDETAVHSTSDQRSDKSTNDKPDTSQKSLWLNRTVGVSEAIGAVAILVILCIFSINRTLQQPEASKAFSAVQSKSGQSETELSENPEIAAPQITLTDSIEESSPVWSVATYSENDRDIIVSGNETGQINIREQAVGPEDIRTTLTLETSSDAVRDIAIAPETRHIVSSSSDGISVWDLDTGELLYTLPSPAPVWSVAITPDESRLISSDYDGNITVWWLYTGEFIYNIEHGSTTWAVEVAPDGYSFFSGGSDRKVHEWNLETGELMQTFTGHQNDVRALAITPDGKTLASGSWDSNIKLWSLDTGNFKTTLEEHSDRVVTLAISPDGKTLASGSIDNTTKLWDLASQQQTSSLEDHTDWVLSTAFIPQNNTLVTAGKDAKIDFWK